jgi:hypothetical protein
MVHADLLKDLKLSKKPSRWVTKLLDEEMKKEQGEDVRGVVAIMAGAL